MRSMIRLLSVVSVMGLVLSVQGCAGTAPERMIGQSDHEGLANYYAQQAQELREKAKQWEFTAEFYEKHADPKAKTDSVQHAAHCRAIAQNYGKAAEEAGPWLVNTWRCAPTCGSRQLVAKGPELQG